MQINNAYAKPLTYQGFTLIELMLVVVVLAILAAFAMPAYQQQMRAAAEKQCQIQVNEIEGLLGKFKSRNLSYRGFDLTTQYPDGGASRTASTLNIPVNKAQSAGYCQLQVSDMGGSTLTAPTIMGSWRIIAIPNQSSKVYNSMSYLLADSTGYKCKTNQQALTVASVNCGVDSQPW